MIKNCAVCGKEFETKIGHRKYCSPECKEKHDNIVAFTKYHLKNPNAQISSRSCGRDIEKLKSAFLKTYKKACIVCGKEFETQVEHKCFCSESCRQKHYRKNKRKPVIKKCLVCGKEFESTNGRLLCSSECTKKRIILKKQSYRAAKLKVAKIKTCEICKKEFEPVVHNHKYCSKECLRIATALQANARFHAKNPNARYNTKNTMVKRKIRKSEIGFCKECGREFKIKSLTPEYYCSEECELKSLHRKQNLFKDTTFTWLENLVHQSWSRAGCAVTN